MMDLQSQNPRTRRPRRFNVTAFVARCLLLAIIAIPGEGRPGFAADDEKSPAKPAPKKNAASKKPPTRLKRPPRLPIENRPYRIRISVAFSGSTRLMPSFRQQVLRSLEDAVTRGYGRMWDVDYVRNDWVRPASAIGLKSLTTDELLRRFPEWKADGRFNYDKVLLICVQANGPRYHLSACEWDTSSRQVGAVETTQTTQRRELGRAMFSLLPRVFQPTLEVERIVGNQVELRLQAATIPALDSELTQLRTDDIIVPYFRYFDKQLVIQRIQFLPWTYLLVEGVQKQYIDSKVISPYGRNPLGSGSVRRVELMAKRVRPRTDRSRLKMVYQTDITKPLIGFHISLVPKRSYRDAVEKPPEKQFSGRDGYVHIPVADESPITWVYVYSGTALLARVPYVPGLSDEEVIPLPDDSIRLAIEGDLELLTSQLIETVARRATLMALAKKTADDEKIPYDEKWKKVDEKFREIAALPTKEEFSTRLTGLREPALSAATRLGNRFAVSRIRRMCNGVGELIQRYLDTEPVEKFRAELYQQRKR